MAQQKKIKNHIKADHILKNFWKDNSRFADLFNACIFDGEQVLKPNDLTEVDTDISSLLQFNGHAETIQKVLDVVKKTALNMLFMKLLFCFLIINKLRKPTLYLLLSKTL